MIQVIKGDLLKSDCNFIIHQANCFATMGAGIAKQIQRLYPESYIVDRNYHIPVGNRNRLGNFSCTDMKNDVVIFNMYSQFHYGRGKQTDYQAFKLALNIILITIIHSGKSRLKIGMPYGIGCGLAGGDWKIVSEIIKSASKEKNVDIFLYKL